MGRSGAGLCFFFRAFNAAGVNTMSVHQQFGKDVLLYFFCLLLCVWDAGGKWCGAYGRYTYEQLMGTTDTNTLRW